MKRLGITAVLFSALAALIVAPSAQAAFGFREFDLSFENGNGTPNMQAGSHPFAVTNHFQLSTVPDPTWVEVPDQNVKDINISLPPGLVGDTTAVPQCADSDFVNIDIELKLPACSEASIVGIATVRLNYNREVPPEFINTPVYSVAASRGSVQKLGFTPAGVPVVIEFNLNTDQPYNVLAHVRYTSQAVMFHGATISLWGNPSGHEHDFERGRCFVPDPHQGAELIPAPGDPACPVNSSAAFVTSPTACIGPQTTTFEADSWQQPGAFWPPESVLTHGGGSPPIPEGFSGCSRLPFAPSAQAVPASDAASSASGLNFNLEVEDPGLTNPTGLAGSDIKEAVVTLPEGVTANASLAAGLEACREEQLAREGVETAPGAGCPQASKIGSLEVETPLLAESLGGSLYLATPYHNLAGDSLLAVYMVIRNENRGILIKQPLRIDADSATGQLVATASNLPQLPFSHFRLHFNEGGRGPLTTPRGCGHYDAKAVLTPWSDGPAVTSTSTFEVVTGNGGAPCPGNIPAFAPSFEAGTLAPVAGAVSPFVLRVGRGSGSAQFRSLEATLPEGLLGKLAGVKECSDAQIAAAAAKANPDQGILERNAPSCPSDSEVGVVNVGAGSGDPIYVQGHAYLAGPYKGAPLSLVVITPAIAGPFDLGSVVVRNALYINETTAQIRAVSDPLPTILQGVPLEIRSIGIDLTRPEFTLNPTSCDRMAVLGTALSTFGQSGSLDSPFQVGGCRGLGFSPKLSLTLAGQTKRTGNPAVHAVLTQPANQAGIAAVTAVLPKSEFIDQAHVNNPCTRVQFNAGAGHGTECPAKSILGTAKAWTPLLERPLQGRVYFRSNGGERRLPDLVVALRGQVPITLVGFIDSVKKKGSEGSRVRTRFAAVPDAPVSRFVLNLAGGSKGLLENSVNLCHAPLRSTVRFSAHNGSVVKQDPAVRRGCGSKNPKRKKEHRHK
jgi:hypothetical protein